MPLRKGQDLKTAMLRMVSSILILLVQGKGISSQQLWAMSSWNDAHATFYGDHNGLGTPDETMGGACGYAGLFQAGYGLQEYTLKNAALSLALFNGGLTCGACFEIKCKYAQDKRWCYAGAPSIIITATNECPENLAKPSNNGGWCNRPRTHFDLSYPMFATLAQPVAGIIPVSYRRVPCMRQGGIRFTMDSSGNRWWTLVFVHNVAGGGDVAALAVQTRSSKSWSPMQHVWGQKWASTNSLLGKSLSFRVTLGSGQFMVLRNVIPGGWTFASTYELASTVQTNSEVQPSNFGTPVSY